MDLRKHYSTVVLSDIHVGSEYFKIKEATRFLKHVNCKQLILNGDIIDGWQLHMPFTFSNISIVPDYTFTSATGKRYYVTHGDFFDTVTTHMRRLAMLGYIGYSTLLRLNKSYNQYRTWRGKPYYYLSQKVKHCVKSAVSYISDFRKKRALLAKKRNAKVLFTDIFIR